MMRSFLFLLSAALAFTGSISVSATENVISTNSADKVAKELSQISAGFVYNLDKAQLLQTFRVLFKNNSQLKSVRIEDYATKQVLISYYRKTSGELVNGTIPDNFDGYEMASSKIVHNGTLLGSIEVMFEPTNSKSDEDSFTKNLIIFAMIFIVFLSVLAVIFKLISSNTNRENRYLSFGTKRFARLVIIALSMFVTLSVSGSWMMLEYNKNAIQVRTKESFYQYLISLSNTLKNVNNIRTGSFQHIFSKNQFQLYYFKIDNALENGDIESANYYREKMTSFWGRYRDFGSGRSKMVMKPDMEIIYSQGKTIPLSEIDRTSDSSFIRAISGESSIMPIRITTNQHTGAKSFQMFFVTPVKDRITGHVMAVAIVEIDDPNSTYRNLDNYHFSETGEMMAFDINGNPLSSPRFLGNSLYRNHSFVTDLLDEAKRNGLSNRMATLHQIIDYRGRKSYAMLHWDRDMNVALVAKIDARELLDDYYGFRNGLLMIVVAMIAFTVPSMLFTFYAGHRSNISLKDSRREIINRLGHAAEFKDNETAMHIVRMSRYTEVLARKYNMPSEWVDLIGNAAPMHDIGKIGVPDLILQKPGKLTSEEWEIMKKHPRFGADIIGNSDDSKLLNMAKEIALYHHEKWDGTGYPVGLSGEHIPLSARMIAIADVFDALTSERPYKKAWKFEDAVTLIVSESGKHFDPRIVKTFKSSLPEFKSIMHKYYDQK